MGRDLGSTVELFVGRAHELGLVEAAGATALLGRGSLVVVSGEAGIGKTRFCEEVAGRAQQAGLRVVTARCWVDGGAPPLWPWHPILAELCGEGAADLLAPAVGLGTVDPDRFARFTAVADRLGTACAQEPTCLIIDDVHAADAGTLLLIRFVARELRRLPLVLLLSRRRGEPADDRTEARLLDEVDVEATGVTLRHFDPHEAAAFLVGHGFGDLDDELMATVVRVTGGNPLFLRRVAALGPPEPGRALPSGVRVAIDQALGRLSPGAQRVLGGGAVLGLVASVAETAAVAGSDPVHVLDAVADATTAGLVTAEGPDRFAFSHELVRSAIEDRLGAAGRLDAHARAARVVASDEPAVPPDRLARRAHHALAAAPRSPADARVAASACRAAAEAMVRSFAYEQAETLLSAAVAQHETSALGPPSGELTVAWAQAALRCGRMTEARARFDRAAAIAQRQGDPVLLAEAALGLGGHWVNEHRAPVERARVLGLQRAALADLPEAQEALRCRLTSRLAAEEVFDGGPVGPVLAALDAARRYGDPAALAEVLSLSHHALFSPTHTWSRLALAEELVRVASEAGDGVLALMGLCWRAVDLFHLGDPRAPRALEDLRERATALACQNVLYIVAVIDVMLLVRAGRLDDAESAAGCCYELGEDVGEVDTLGYLSTQLLGIRWCQGREVELLEAAEDVAVSPTLIRAEFALRASAIAIAARAGQLERAQASLDILTAGGLETLPTSSTWTAGMAAIVEAAELLADRTVARQAYDLLAPSAGLPVIASLGVLCLGSTERLLGTAALTFGDDDRAVDHFERALVANRRLGNRPLVAITRADLARALRRRGHPDDRARIVDLLERVARDATRMGMTARAQACEAELSTLRTADEPGIGPKGNGRRRDVAIRRGSLRRDGSRWIVELADRRVRVGDLVGMTYLAELLTQPGEPIPALALASYGVVQPPPTRHELIDDEARANYAARARELTRDLADAEADNDIGRAEKLRDEIDALVDELEVTAGLNHHARTFTDNSERARTAVRKAIKRAIDTIDDADATIADALRATVVTGTECVYTPDPRAPVTWSTHAPATGDR